MAKCQLDTDYQIFDDSFNQIRSLKLSADGKTLEINSFPSGSNECTINVDSVQGVGLEVSGNNFRIVAPIAGLNKQLSDDPGAAEVKVEKNAGVLKIIGLGDQVMGLEANIRYNTATNKVIMEY